MNENYMKAILSILAVGLPYLLKMIDNTRDVRLRKGNRSERLDFINSFTAFGLKRRSRYAIEEAFNIFLGKSYSYEEITYILQLANPTIAFRKLSEAREHVEYSTATGGFTYKKHVSTSFRRRTFQVRNFSAYLALIGLFYVSMMFFNAEKDHVIAMIMLFCAILSLIAAVIMLTKSSSLREAKVFMVEASKIISVEGSSKNTPTPAANKESVAA
ncbi:hypothetical protein [Chromobacterium subtsugae]|uniref:hypothetical protein n=1 Tax=Chromobacterium subtsugae TaxID=251747 RepID=UPI0006415F41|nr:hypothetical protein [Chromobacterium subtsugae]